MTRQEVLFNLSVASCFFGGGFALTELNDEVYHSLSLKVGLVTFFLGLIGIAYGWFVAKEGAPIETKSRDSLSEDADAASNMVPTDYKPYLSAFIGSAGVALIRAIQAIL